MCVVIVHRRRVKGRKGNSVSAGSQPPTGALCMKSVGFTTLSSHTGKGDSINYISQRALQHRKRQQTHRDRERERDREKQTTRKGEGTGNVTTILGWDRRKERVARNKSQRLQGERDTRERKIEKIESETNSNADRIFGWAGDRWGWLFEGDHCYNWAALLHSALCLGDIQ